MNLKLTTIILSALIVGTSITSGIYFSKNKKAQKELSYLRTSITSLRDELENKEDEITALKEENEEMQEQLQTVQHFDDGNFSNSYSGSGGLAYTGSAVETKIDGEFTGWEGETIFKMMNGSIWQQASYDYTYHYAYMPDVLIYSKSGSYYMRVEGVDEEIRVIRVK